MSERVGWMHYGVWKYAHIWNSIIIACTCHGLLVTSDFPTSESSTKEGTCQQNTPQTTQKQEHVRFTYSYSVLFMCTSTSKAQDYFD